MGLWVSIGVVQPLWTPASFGFPNDDQVQIFTPDNYDPEAVISVCQFGSGVRAAVTLTPSSDYIELLLPSGATNVHINSEFSQFRLDCGIEDIPATYMALPDPSPPRDIHLLPELKGAHYSNSSPAPNGIGGNPFILRIETRWWALSPSQTRQRVALYFEWPGAIQVSNFTDRDMWVQVSTMHEQLPSEGLDPNTWVQVPMYVVWVLDPNSAVVETPIDSSVTNLHGFPFVATQVSSSNLLRLAWRDTSLADSRDVRLFVGGIAIGIFGGLLTTVLFAVAVGIDVRVASPRAR